MAEISGFKCDRPGCSTLVTEIQRGTRPDGWLRLNVNRDEGFDLCSTECVMILVGERYGAEQDDPTAARKFYTRLYHREYRASKKDKAQDT